MFLSDIHAGLMIIGFFMFFFGFLTARFMKRKKWWLKAHKFLGLSGVSAIISGFFIIIYEIIIYNSSYFAFLHSYTGLAILIFAVIMPVLGFMQFKLRKAGAKIRLIHRYTGWTTLIMMVINIVLGMRMTGFITFFTVV